MYKIGKELKKLEQTAGGRKRKKIKGKK